jgi:choline monooxygenase
MDTNFVLPLGPDRCRVLFDFYFDSFTSEQFIADCINAAHQAQLEDQEACEEVQRGLKSPTYSTRRFGVKRKSG